MKPLTQITEPSNLNNRIPDSSFERTFVMMEPMEDNGGVGDIDGVDELGSEVMLGGVGEGGRHHCSTEFTTRDSTISNNLTLSRVKLAMKSTGG